MTTAKQKCTFTGAQWKSKVKRDAQKIQQQKDECAALEWQIQARENQPGNQLDAHKALFAKVRKANDKARGEFEEQARLAKAMKEVQEDDSLTPEQKCPQLEALANELYRGTPGKYKGIKPPSACITCLGKQVARSKPWVRSTSDATLKEINTELGTSVDFSKLSQFEGGQWLQAYLPCAGGVVAGNSGVTVCTGCDLGQKSEAELKALGLSEATFDKIKKFAGKKYKDKTCADANKQLDELGRVTLEADECDAIDKAIKREHLKAARDSWNARVGPGGKKFEQLTTNQQTVIFSRTYHQGKNMPNSDVAQDFYNAALQGDWAAAKTNLENYDVSQKWYQERVKAEAQLL